MKSETAVQWLRTKILIECLDPVDELFEQAFKIEKETLENFTIKNINNKKVSKMQEQKEYYESLNDIDRQDQNYYENTPMDNPFHLSVVTEATVLTLHDHFDAMIQAVKNGELDALSLYTISKEVKDIADKVNRDVQELAIEEAENRTEKSFKYGSKMVTKVEGRRMIDYSDIEEWQIAKDNLKEIEEKYKQVALSKVSSLDETTGEVLQRPIITFSKSSIMIKNV